MPPLPKDPSQRVRRNKDERLSLARDGEVRGPDPSEEWHPDTVIWWETWRRSIQSQLFEDTDWSRLRMMSRVVDRFHSDKMSPNAQKELLAEIRQNEQKLGATLEDRIRLKLDIRDAEQRQVDPREQALAEVVQLTRGA